jgi:bla regulator protein blaR1
MTDYLLQLTPPLSLLLLLLLIAQSQLLKPLGARTIYALWSTVPLFLLLSVVSPLLPLQSAPQALQRYQVSVQQLVTSAAAVNWLFWLWLAGVMVCVSFLLLGYLNNRALFKRATPVPHSSLPVGCRLASDNTGPYITGFLSPAIVLPHDFFSRYDALQQKLILQHELTHWQRGDLHLNYLALFVVSLFWFNPLVWLAYKQYRQAQELACDALATKYAGKAEKIAYGYALLSSTQQTPQYGWLLTHHYGDFNTMKQRIMQLQNQHGLSKTVVAGTMALVIATTLLLQQPVLAGSNKTQPLAPVVRIEPRYPVTAAKQGISGFVRMTFDVNGNGEVENVKVVKSSPKEIFDKEAVVALQKWRYTATGAVHKGQQVQLDFELDVVAADMERISVTPPPPKKG